MDVMERGKKRNEMRQIRKKWWKISVFTLPHSIYFRTVDKKTPNREEIISEVTRGWQMWKDNRHFIVYTNTLLSDNDKLSDNEKALITFMVTENKPAAQQTLFQLSHF